MAKKGDAAMTVFDQVLRAQLCADLILNYHRIEGTSQDPAVNGDNRDAIDIRAAAAAGQS